MAHGDTVQRQVAGRGHLQDSVGGRVGGNVGLDDRVTRAVAGDRHLTGDDRELAAIQGDGVVGGEGDAVGADPRGTFAVEGAGGHVAVGGSDRLAQGAGAVVGRHIGIAVDDDSHRGVGRTGIGKTKQHCQNYKNWHYSKFVHDFLLIHVEYSISTC